MNKFMIWGMMIWWVLWVAPTFALNPTIRILSPEMSSTYTGSLVISVALGWQTESGLLNCDLKKVVSARKSLFWTAFVVWKTDTWYTFPLDLRLLRMKKWNYHLTCSLYDLTTNALEASDSVKFRVNLPPPIVYFAKDPRNLIRNPTFSEKRGELPAYWGRWWFGKNDYTQDDLFTGLVSSGSLRSTITHYVSGDVKWYFYDVPVTGGKTYIFAQKYHTNVPVKLVVRYIMKDGTYQYDDLQLLPVTEWPYASTKVYFVTPKDATYLTVWTSLATEGSVTIDDVLLELSPGSE